MLGSATIVVALVATVGALAHDLGGGPRARTSARAASAALELQGAVDRCAAQRERGYRSGDGEDCLSLTTLARREPALARLGDGRIEAHLTPISSDRGYVVQVGAWGSGWFTIARDASGFVRRVCTREPLASLEPDPKADFPGCEDGLWPVRRRGG
jgi:hypothetical protein